jgi:hypothetical protein
VSVARLRCVTPAQIDEAEQLGRMFGLTYLSAEGYEKLAWLIADVRDAREVASRTPEPFEIAEEFSGWRVG